MATWSGRERVNAHTSGVEASYHDAMEHNDYKQLLLDPERAKLVGVPQLNPTPTAKKRVRSVGTFSASELVEASELHVLCGPYQGGVFNRPPLVIRTEKEPDVELKMFTNAPLSREVLMEKQVKYRLVAAELSVTNVSACPNGYFVAAIDQHRKDLSESYTQDIIEDIAERDRSICPVDTNATAWVRFVPHKPSDIDHWVKDPDEGPDEEYDNKFMKVSWYGNNNTTVRLEPVGTVQDVVTQFPVHENLPVVTTYPEYDTVSVFTQEPVFENKGVVTSYPSFEAVSAVTQEATYETNQVKQPIPDISALEHEWNDNSIVVKKLIGLGGAIVMFFPDMLKDDPDYDGVPTFSKTYLLPQSAQVSFSYSTSYFAAGTSIHCTIEVYTYNNEWVEVSNLVLTANDETSPTSSWFVVAGMFSFTGTARSCLFTSMRVNAAYSNGNALDGTVDFQCTCFNTKLMVGGSLDLQNYSEAMYVLTDNAVVETRSALARDENGDEIAFDYEIAPVLTSSGVSEFRSALARDENGENIHLVTQYGSVMTTPLLTEQRATSDAVVEAQQFLVRFNAVYEYANYGNGAMDTDNEKSDEAFRWQDIETTAVTEQTRVSTAAESSWHSGISASWGEFSEGDRENDDEEDSWR